MKSYRAKLSQLPGNARGRTMAWCSLLDSCFFFKNGLAEMPCTTECLREKYCKGNYTACARYVVSKTYGRDRVPRHLSPTDEFETQKVH